MEFIYKHFKVQYPLNGKAFYQFLLNSNFSIEYFSEFFPKKKLKIHNNLKNDDLNKCEIV